jgi:murein DD-endopeptidase MepM/ murein hydrolase activator NlpD
MARLPFESEYLYGLHDPGGEHLMRDAGRKGWILFTEAIGSDPSHEGGSNSYAGLSAEGFGIIVRLNNGYYPDGTIPHSSRYEAFAQRCASFARNSPGAKIWIIGNETNYLVERPGVQIDWERDVPRDEDESAARALRHLFSLDNTQETHPRMLVLDPGQAITPEQYARCYTLCRDAIHGQAGHGDDLVLTSAAAPWNINTTYSGNPDGDWVQYFSDVLTLLGPDGCDGITLHTYTHGSDPALIEQDHYMASPGFEHRHYDFRTYIDFMEAIPAAMRHLPVYITEADQDVSWDDRADSSWVQRAYAEIDRWNGQPNHAQIRALILYRWPRVGGSDRWWIVGKGNVIQDLQRAMQHGYRWRPEAVPEPGPPPPTPTFEVGQQIYVSALVNIRRSPGYRNKPADDVYGHVVYRTPATVQGPPSQADGLIWWQVRTTLQNGDPVEGWMAEAAANGTQLLSAEMPPPLPGTGIYEPGEQVAIVSPDPVNLRHTPGYVDKPQGDVVATLPPATGLSIIEGAQQADGLFWWRVRGTVSGGQDIEGWVAEAAPNGVRLLAPMSSSRTIRVGRPFQGQWPVTQWWGSNPDFYRRFTYDGVPLKGHNGIDFALPGGTPLVATDRGRVKRVGFEAGGFGHYVLLDHEWGESIYAHQERVNVQQGQAVEAGEVIGWSDNTGASTGPHLHFGIRILPYRRTDGWGGFANPVPFMDPADLVGSRELEMEPTPMGEEVLENPRP